MAPRADCVCCRCNGFRKQASRLVAGSLLGIVPSPNLRYPVVKVLLFGGPPEAWRTLNNQGSGDAKSRDPFRHPMASSPPFRTVIYARVSTKDRQEALNQLRELRALCKRDPELKLVAEYVDHESGGTADRPQFRRLLEEAHRRQFDLVLFWALDRFSREGALATLNHLRELESYGVGFRSYTERYLDSTGLFKEAIVALLATLAKQERLRLSERVKAGMERARAEGRRISRPPLLPEVRTQIRDLLAKGRSQAAVARELRLSRATVQKYLRG